MPAVVPSLTGSLYLTDPQSVIAYTFTRYSRTPAKTVPLNPDLIISLNWQLARFGEEPETLVNNIQSDLQKTYDRIFARERDVKVSCTHEPNGVRGYDITVSVFYTELSGDVRQTGAIISLDQKGRLIIPENNLSLTLRG